MKAKLLNIQRYELDLQLSEDQDLHQAQEITLEVEAEAEEEAEESLEEEEPEVLQEEDLEEITTYLEVWEVEIDQEVNPE